MSYTIDVYRGEAPVQNKQYHKLRAYVAMFPQLIAGPIVRYQDIAAELNTRTESLERFSWGSAVSWWAWEKRSCWPIRPAPLWTEITAILPADRSVLMVWMGILAFAFQIYFDFSGYSDMAIGMGHMLGFHFPENFNYPYISKVLRNSGGDGIFPWAPGLRNTCTSLWAATGRAAFSRYGTSWSYGS